MSHRPHRRLYSSGVVEGTKGALLCIRHVTHIAGIFFPVAPVSCTLLRHLSLAAILFRLVSLASFPSFPSSVLSSMLLFASPPSPFLIVGFVRVNFARLRFAHVLAFGFSRQLFHFLFSFHRWLSVHRSFSHSASVRGSSATLAICIHPPFPVSLSGCAKRGRLLRAIGDVTLPSASYFLLLRCRPLVQDCPCRPSSPHRVCVTRRYRALVCPHPGFQEDRLAVLYVSASPLTSSYACLA